jgi:hypothetical protein
MLMSIWLTTWHHEWVFLLTSTKYCRNLRDYYICYHIITIVVTYEIRVFFEGAKKEVFSSIFKKTS